MRFGIDVGRARIGVARSDAAGMLATPVETVPRDGDLDAAVARVAALVAGAFELVVGLPISLSGGETPSTADSRDFAARLARATGVPVRLVDERLTTVEAQSALHRNGRDTRRSRGVIDQVAAVILLQHALDTEVGRGVPPGALIDPATVDTPTPPNPAKGTV